MAWLTTTGRHGSTRCANPSTCCRSNAQTTDGFVVVEGQVGGRASNAAVATSGRVRGIRQPFSASTGPGQANDRVYSAGPAQSDCTSPTRASDITNTQIKVAVSELASEFERARDTEACC